MVILPSLAIVLGMTVPARTDMDPEPSVIWHVAGEGRGTPAAYQSRVYFLSRHHEVVAVDAVSGRRLWTRSTNESGDSTNGSLVRVTASNVIVGDYHVLSFRHDGQKAWRFMPAGGGGEGMYLGTASDQTVFAGSPAGRLYAIDVTSGTARWAVSVRDDGKTTVFAPVLDKGLVIATFTSFTAPNAGGIFAVDARTGQERWCQSLPSSAVGKAAGGSAGGPVIAADVVIAANGDGVIHGFDRWTGLHRWSIPARPEARRDGREAPDFRALALSGRRLFAGSLTGIVAAYDLDTRNELWRQTPLDSSVALGMTSDDRLLYVPYLSGHLVALDAVDGTVRWRTSDGSRGFTWTPLAADQRIFATASGAGFFAFRP